jgi:pre-mRNA-processing factor 19
MSNFICAISGVVAEDPVASPVSGEIFERRLITKFIDDNGTDPINGEKLKASEVCSFFDVATIKFHLTCGRAFIC